MHKIRSLVFLLCVMLAACSAPASPTASSALPNSSALPSSAAGASIGAGASAEFAATATAAAQGGSLNVFAAASLTEAFMAIGQQFDAANGSQTTFNFAGSQQLAQQIVQGAPADVFASANAAQMRVVLDSGDVISGTQQTFVRNRLVVIHPQDNPAGLQTLADLAKPGVKLVLADKAVPVGQYALDFLAKAPEDPQYTVAYSETVLANVVSYEENVRAVLTKVALGEADAGIVYTSDVAQSTANEVGRIEIPDKLNTIASYPIAPLAASSNVDLARQFVEYVLSPDGQRILSSYGFIPATSP